MTVRAGGRAGLPGAVALRTRILHDHAHALDPGIVLLNPGAMPPGAVLRTPEGDPPGRSLCLEPEDSVRGANAREEREGVSLAQAGHGKQQRRHGHVRNQLRP